MLTTSKRMQHNVEIFLSSELGHSRKGSAKLLGREQRNDFHHNQTTPLLKGMWAFPWVYQFQFRIWKTFHSHRRQLSNLSDNAPRALEIMSVNQKLKSAQLNDKLPSPIVFQPIPHKQDPTKQNTSSSVQRSKRPDPPPLRLPFLLQQSEET
uniref:Uncharacterized protein n=1 Tax=Solanum tuberosum TaxID=4113 RepID=M1D957_SOLTU